MVTVRDLSTRGVSFDLGTQDGILQALYAVRSSELATAERNELRDQLFTLSRSNDPRLREQIAKRLDDLPLSETYVSSITAKNKKSDQAGGQISFARSRKTPRFAVRNTIETPTETTFTPETIEHDTKSATVTDSSQTIDPDTAQQPVAPDALVQSAPDAMSTNASVPTETPQAPGSQPTAMAAGDKPPTLERIREIKRYVNGKVGNPVNLVDRDSEIGRAYMTALLAAMQSVNNETGMAGAAQMEELERIFTQVQILLESPTSTTDSSPMTENTTPSAASVADAVPSTTETHQADAETEEVRTTPGAAPVADEVHASPEPSTNTVEAAQPAMSQPAIPSQDAATKTVSVNPNATAVAQNMNPGTKEKSSAVPNTDVTPQAQPAAQPANPESSLASAKAKLMTSPAAVSPVQPATSAAVGTGVPESAAAGAGGSHIPENNPTPVQTTGNPVPVRTSEPVATTHSQAANQPVFTPHIEKTTEQPDPSVSSDIPNSIDSKLAKLDAAAAANNTHTGDPLYAPEVDAGLEQLLMEWSLFKTSGLFGTGPNGREHPLFKKLAPQMLNNILLGKFDGSRPEIIQSITDYMNGWRYEQGIVYQPGETFEQYLRRVIRFIIDGKE